MAKVSRVKDNSPLIQANIIAVNSHNTRSNVIGTRMMQITVRQDFLTSSSEGLSPSSNLDLASVMFITIYFLIRCQSCFSHLSLLKQTPSTSLQFSQRPSARSRKWRAAAFFTFRLLVVEELRMVSILSNLRLQLCEFCRVEKRERSPFLLCVA